MHCAKKCALFMLIVALAATAATALGLRQAGEWLSDSDLPRKADAIVVLGGSFARPFQAADLYRQGLAPKIYVSVPVREHQYRLLDEAGIAYPREEEVARRILLQHGVPASAIEYLGKDLISTAAEARATHGVFARGAPKLLIVSSPYHLRRARMTFTDALPAAEIGMIASSYDPLPQAWWRDQSAARNVLSELAKIAFYQLGGRY